MAKSDAAWSEQISSTAFGADYYTKPPVCRADDGNRLHSETPAGFALGGVLGNSDGHVGGKLACAPREVPQLPLAPFAEVLQKLGLARAGAGASTSGGVEGDTKASKVHERPSSGI